MRLKTFIFLFALVVSSYNCLFAQETTLLSEEGARYWKAAEALLSMSSETDYVVRATKELEKATQSDPNYAETFYKLATLYSQLGKENGNDYFNLAEANYQKYKRLRPSEAKKIDDEIYVLNVIRESSINQWPIEERANYLFAQYEGIWEGDGIKVWISGLYNVGKYSGILGYFHLYSYYDNGINGRIWDSSTDAVTTGFFINTDGTLQWSGHIIYDSKAHNNRNRITEYLVGESWHEYDTQLSKGYTASIKDGNLIIECKTINYYFSNGRTNGVRSQRTENYVLSKQ